MNAPVVAPVNTTEVVAAIATSLNNSNLKMDADTVAANEVIYKAAMQYAQDYSGTFSFMISMQVQVLGGQWLTKGQAAAVINCAVAEYRRNQPAEQQAPAAPVAASKVVADGWYTIVGPKGGHRTLRLQAVEGEPVKQWLAYLSGSDNEGDYTSIGFVTGTEVRLFNKYIGQYTDIVAAARFLVRNAANIGEYGRQYALQSGKCYVCNRKLTTPESIAAGIGPVCASKGL